MHIYITTIWKSRTARSDKNINSCPKTFVKTVTGYIFYHTSKILQTNKKTRKIDLFSAIPKTYKDVKFTVDVSAFQTLCCCFCVPIRFLVDTSSWSRQLPTLVMFQSGKEQRRRPVVDSKGRVLAKFVFNLVSLFSVHTAILLFS